MTPARKIPTLNDLDALPPGIKGEIIEGVLYTMTRPRSGHQHASLGLGGQLWTPADHGTNGPDDWWVLCEPGIELPNTPEISPDVAGWQRKRLPRLPNNAAITVVPDWVCEILSPTTQDHNLLVKKPYYARIGVKHHWIIDLAEQTLTAYRLVAGRWQALGVYGDEHDARIEPFADHGIDVASLWLTT
jgi:Uma2 family endonuclease